MAIFAESKGPYLKKKKKKLLTTMGFKFCASLGEEMPSDPHTIGRIVESKEAR